ncbi:unnamed protein product [Moneuplotes crassus]|uniref:Uncharacterized protein n=1 Tax=Euplotes crassus TaxID=5936 RepID=A0AAD2D534_EUPCR|nr:unnamed protein product [Moneuplotes crassus]
MDIYSPLNNFSQTNFPIWSYSDLLLSLDSRFCLCILSQGTSETQESCDLLSSESHGRLHVSGKTCNARDILLKLHRSINNALTAQNL